MGRLTKFVAIVTGGARDIGRAISLKFAEEGAKVCLHYHESEEKAKETKKAIESKGGEVIIVKGDITRYDDSVKIVEECKTNFGDRIDILVNNAGGLVARKKLQEMDLQFWNKVISLNLTSTFILTQLVVPFMNKGGSIVNLSSQAARDGGGSGASAYAASKGGVLTFTKSMAKELGPKGIRVNAISAGMINTSFHDRFTKPEIRANVSAISPLGREGNAEEIADLACFLASKESSYITGASVEINGGLYFI